MFRKSDTSRQLSLYSSISQHLSASLYQVYTNADSWHNMFYCEVVSRIDENLFAPLFCDNNGAPNVSIRVLIGMMIIKEGEGISDQKLFESVRFNLLTRKALGLVNLEDPIPAESTYYLFRQRLKEYFEDNNIDLLEKCFQQITKAQALNYKVSGHSLRMDSKLIGSNIAFYSRYELVYKTLFRYYKATPYDLFSLLSEKHQVLLKYYLDQKPEQTVYHSTKDQIREKLQELGILTYHILELKLMQQSEEYLILERVFEEQYRVDDQWRTQVKENNEISAKSVQSPHDTQCTYRKKNEEKTKGYSHNITETCDAGNNVNLITDIQTDVATIADNEFVELGVENSQDVINQRVECLHADGAYNDSENQIFASENGLEFYLTGFQGAPARYQITIEQDAVKCIDTKEDHKEIEVIVTKKGRYRIKVEKGYRYFTYEDIQSQELRRQIEQIPREIANIRNNVEASIYQLAYHLRKDKTKYRGLFKNKIWAVLRCTWVNCVRITNYIQKIAKNKKENLDLTTFFVILFSLCKVKALRIA